MKNPRRLLRPRFTVRRLMGLVVYIALDFAGFYNATWHGSNRWLLVFLALIIAVPPIVDLWWFFRRMDRSGVTFL